MGVAEASEEMRCQTEPTSLTALDRKYVTVWAKTARVRVVNEMMEQAQERPLHGTQSGVDWNGRRVEADHAVQSWRSW